VGTIFNFGLEIYLSGDGGYAVPEPISEEMLKNAHAHAKVVHGQVTELVINPNGCYAGREDDIKRFLEQCAREAVEIAGPDHMPIHYIVPNF
jgi:hypothetical protein